MSEAAVEEGTETEEAADPGPQPVPSGLSMQFVRKSIDNLTKDNFAETLSSIEPYLINDAGVSIYKKSLRRIASKAKILGATVPEGYAKEAFCTAKRRAKQSAFIQGKEEERLAAEAEAAEAAEAEAAAAAEAAAEAEAAPEGEEAAAE